MMLTKVNRLALGLLAGLAVTIGTVAAPVAGSAHAGSLSLNVGVVDRGTARAASIDRNAGEEIPSRDLSVAAARGYDAHSAGSLAGSKE